MAHDSQLCDFSTEERQELASHLKTNHVNKKSEEGKTEPVKKKMKKNKKVQCDPDNVK